MPPISTPTPSRRWAEAQSRHHRHEEERAEDACDVEHRGRERRHENRSSEFSIPMNAAATATSVRNGSMMRVSRTVSSSFPGTLL